MVEKEDRRMPEKIVGSTDARQLTAPTSRMFTLEDFRAAFEALSGSGVVGRIAFDVAGEEK